MELTAQGARVLGALLEKERTVPDTYPMTLKGLTGACNQTSNRTPVVSYDENAVQRTLDDLKAEGLVRFVHPSHGERSIKFRQVLDEKLGLEPAAAALIAVLLLRGAQTSGELRTRSERLHAFGSVAEVEEELRALAGREEPLVRLLGRRPGEREARWVQLLTGEPAAGEPVADAPMTYEERGGGELAGRVEALEGKVARLYALLGEADEEPEEPTAESAD